MDDLDTETADHKAFLERQDFEFLMSRPEGRRFICRMLAATGVFRTSYTGEAYSTFFREGERNVGLKIMAAINNWTPDVYPQLLEDLKHV